MKFIYDDGGRSKYFKSSDAGDCVCRAISIATEMDYKVIYDLLNEYVSKERKHKHEKFSVSARDGIRKTTMRKVLADLGWKWIPTMNFGTGCTVHLKEDELPCGRLIVQVSKHLTCVIDGALHDTYDCSREGTRCVYGYFIREE